MNFENKRPQAKLASICYSYYYVSIWKIRKIQQQYDHLKKDNLRGSIPIKMEDCWYINAFPALWIESK